MRIKYDDTSEFPCDVKPGGVIVMPVNLQGIMEFGADARRFKHEFPAVYKKYVHLCIKGFKYPGDIEIITEGKFTIALLFYKSKEVGTTKDTNIALDVSLSQCLTKLLTKFPDNTKFYSPSLPFKNSQMKIVYEPGESEWVVMGGT